MSLMRCGEDNDSVPINGDIYDYEVMEAFIVSTLHSPYPTWQQR